MPRRYEQVMDGWKPHFLEFYFSARWWKFFKTHCDNEVCVKWPDWVLWAFCDKWIRKQMQMAVYGERRD